MDPRFEELVGRKPTLVGDLPFDDGRIGYDLTEINRLGGEITHIVVNLDGYKSLRETSAKNVFYFENGEDNPPMHAWGAKLLIAPNAAWRYNVYANFRLPKAA